MSRIEQIVMAYFDHNDFNLKNVINFLEEDHAIRYQIWHEKEQFYRKNDIEAQIQEYNYNYDTDISFNDEEMNLMLEEYNDVIDDSDEWYYCCRHVVEKWCEDKAND